MNGLLSLHPARWNLIISASPMQLLIATAYLAHASELIVLDCGRRFDSSVVARAAWGRPEIIDRIKVQRAFICSEVVKLLEKTPSGKTPILIFDFLSTFYDENVKTHTRKFLLESSIQHFQRLSQGAGLAVTVQPPSSGDDLYQRLYTSASQVSMYEARTPRTEQLSLF